MNCDQVFRILTRGPFPTGGLEDFSVEAHLESCPGCRRLADALRPATDLALESIEPEESRGLPGYHPTGPWRSDGLGHPSGSGLWSAAVARRWRRTVERQPVVPLPATWNASRRATLALLMLALGVGVAVGCALRRAPASGGDADIPRARGRATPNPAARWSLSSPRLAEECFAASGDRAGIGCCTLCHRSQGAAHVTLAANSTVRASCRECHLD